MTIKTINASQIREISPKGITYTEEDDSEGFIDFEMCFQNFLKPRLSQEAYNEHMALNPTNYYKTYDEYVEKTMKSPEVGRRNVGGNKDGYFKEDPKSGKPYFVFYDEPQIAIEFEDSNELAKVRRMMREHNWYTFDVT